MEMIFSPKAIEDLNYWKKLGNKAVQKKIKVLLVAIQESPYEGSGKP
jgi:toxin YoeB